MKKAIPILFCLLSSLVLWQCGGSKEKQTQSESVSQDSLPRLSTNDRILGVARIEPEDGITSLTAGVNGKIAAVLMDENQLVKQGQSLLNIEISVENAQLNQAQSKIAAQQAVIEAGRGIVEGLRVSRDQAQTVYMRNRQLYDGKALTLETLENSKAVLDKLDKDLETAMANLKQSSARVQELESDIAYYRTVVGRKRVNAPMAGKILNVLVKTGEFVDNATVIAEFAPAGATIAKTEVDELFAEKVHLGQKATILSQTTGETLAEGTVSYAADYLKAKSLFKDQATELEDRRVREVHVKLISGKIPLFGSRVDCLIFLK
jgi:HlyD family secretion protein